MKITRPVWIGIDSGLAKGGIAVVADDAITHNEWLHDHSMQLERAKTRPLTWYMEPGIKLSHRVSHETIEEIARYYRQQVGHIQAAHEIHGTARLAGIAIEGWCYMGQHSAAAMPVQSGLLCYYLLGFMRAEYWRLPVIMIEPASWRALLTPFITVPTEPRRDASGRKIPRRLRWTVDEVRQGLERRWGLDMGGVDKMPNNQACHVLDATAIAACAIAAQKADPAGFPEYQGAGAC